jgi:uncharacterized protein
MEYRKLEKLNVAPSLLGFGCMRFPVTPNQQIDEEKAKALLDQSIANGVTYIDTAYPYHEKKSEAFVGRALSKYKRADYFLATKLPVWMITETSQVRAYFEEQCLNLQTDYIDFYLFHALNKERWENIKKLKMIEEVEKLREEKKIRFIGFSFHDEYPIFEEILTYKDWDFCQIQLNYVDTNIQQGLKGYDLATERGVPVIIMEPVKGGALARLPDEMEKVFKGIHPERSVASWAFRYVASLNNVKIVLSGMSDMQQVEDNLKTFTDFKPLNTEEMLAVEQVTKIYNSRQMNGCTGCNYCMPCPYGVDIPGNFAIWNRSAIYEDMNKGQSKYDALDDKKKASACQACGVCESKCPQSITIIEDLKKVSKLFEKK